MKNLLGSNGMNAAGHVIGKAEHLKVLLQEWMRRNDSHPKGLYSDAKWNLGEGEGDKQEINARRTWRRVGMWISDTVLSFDRPFRMPNSTYRRYEYLYVGRTKRGGRLNISSISIEGRDKHYFRVRPKSATINTNGHKRIKVAFVSNSNKVKTVKGLEAFVVIRNNDNEVWRIRITGEE